MQTWWRIAPGFNSMLNIEEFVASDRTIKKTAGGTKTGRGVNADVGENMILSNRDKAQDSGRRGQDSKAVQTDQMQDHSANRDEG
jgi:hypothetical protein